MSNETIRENGNFQKQEHKKKNFRLLCRKNGNGVEWKRGMTILARAYVFPLYLFLLFSVW